MWPTTPHLHLSRPAGPSSPPETPRTASPVFTRQNSPKLRGSPSRDHPKFKPMAQPPNNIRGPANGPNFNFGRPVRPDQLSPRSSSSSAASTDSDSSDSGSDSSEQPDAPPSPRPMTTSRISNSAPNFVVVEMGNFEPGDAERDSAVRPTAFEYPESDRSRSRSRNPPPEMDRSVMYQFGNLDCSDDESDPDAEDEEDEMDEDDEHRAFLLKQRAEKKIKRMTSGSICKRTISESIGSDTDMEDLKMFLDASQVGSSARRLKRRMSYRRSLQFHDPPLPRIAQMDEPSSSEDEFLDDDALKELPYYTLEYISMEIDSP